MIFAGGLRSLIAAARRGELVILEIDNQFEANG